jgi:hypothetical protein
MAARKQGESVQALADALTAKYETVVSAQSVRYHTRQTTVQPHKVTEKETTASDVEMILDAVERMGYGKQPLSGATYDRWRAHLDATDRAQYPSLQTIRRRYGKWSAFMDAAGLQCRPTYRQYFGLTRTDAILHLAMWLRTMRVAGRIEEPTSAKYRLWSKENLSAPSVESLRKFGAWTVLVGEASELEKTSFDRKSVLPEPASVSQRGRKKTPVARKKF